MTQQLKKSYNADCIIVGAGIFGLYAAYLLQKKGKKAIVIEKSLQPFSRASSINQARVHKGYHYPRSHETALSSALYYDRFAKEFNFAINNTFKQIYAIASENSKTTSQEFIDFCKAVNISLAEIPSNIYFKPHVVEATFLADEYSFDFLKIKAYLMNKIKENTTFYFDTYIENAEKHENEYILRLSSGITCSAPVVLNATYSGINHVIEKFGEEKFDLKYELCEVSFCSVSENLKSVGITVMDGDYFSIMPFGTTDTHSLTSVKHTPRYISYESISKSFMKNGIPQLCIMHHVHDCFICTQSLNSAWTEMSKLYSEFLKPEFSLKHKFSRFEVKAILVESEADDSRPTVIKKHTTDPTFISVLSGKLSTIYDLEHYI